jgi:cation transport regulator ChaB
MPYKSISALPASVKVLPKHAQEIFRNVVNSVLDKGGSEESAFRQGWAAVKNAGYKKNKDGKWIKANSNALLAVQAHTTTTDIRRDTYDDREYLIVPVVPIVAGVLNGYLVPAEEIARYVESWNGIPLPINHPMVGETPVSANTPQRLTECVGRFWNAHFEHNRLKGELWIDMAKCESLGGEALDVLHRLEAGEPLEVSTAFWSDDDDTTGTYNGRAYMGIRRNLRPDHLALLPNAVGACCWGDGCGAPRTHDLATHCTCHEGATMTDEPLQAARHGFRTMILDTLREFFSRTPQPPVTQQTDVDIREAVQSALTRESGDAYYCYLEAIEGNRAIYRHGQRLLARTFSTGEDGVIALADDEEEVQRDTTYRPVVAQQADDPPQETSAATADTNPPDEAENQPAAAAEQETEQPQEDDMADKPTDQQVTDNAALITKLTANAQSGWTEKDAPLLQTFSTDQLTKLVEKADAASTVTANAEHATQQDTDQPATKQPEQPKKLSLQEYVANAPDEVRDSLTDMVEQAKQRRTEVLAALKANKRCKYTIDALQAKPTKELLLLEEMLRETDYSGQGFAAHQQPSDDDQPPPPPSTLDQVVELQAQRRKAS